MNRRLLMVCAFLNAGLFSCGVSNSAAPPDEELTATSEELAAVAASVPLGSFIGNISAADFAAAQTNFNAVEEIEDGVGPVFNEKACGNCHTEGASGGAGLQIERRYGRFVNGKFDSIGSKGGSLRQLFSVGTFTSATGNMCRIPVETEPSEASVRNVGRLVTPLFGLGLVDAMPDAFFDLLALFEPPEIRGTVNRVKIVLPNPDDATQAVGSTRVGRFGWKSGVATLSQFGADAYLNEMGITTQNCSRGVSVLSFATESAPNGVAVAPGCDDLAPAAPMGVPVGTDDSVGSCAGGRNELQEDVENFRRFMTHLAPPPRKAPTLASLRGKLAFIGVGCAGCHTDIPFVTPSAPSNGVPANRIFFPYSDFLVHDMGSLGDQIGNDGDTLEQTRRMRTAPLWGARFRSHFLHDGRSTTISDAVRAHDGQGAAARDAFNALSAGSRADVLAFVNSL
jgi:CxxC motif-containing protein (DUF1111 family)